MQASRRGFWRALSIREGRAATFLPAEVDEPQRGDVTLAALDVARFAVPITPAADAPATAPAAARFMMTPDAAAAADRQRAPAPNPDEVCC